MLSVVGGLVVDSGRPIIQVKDLRKSFGLSEVLRGITLDVSAGSVLSIIGASGSGKSTFLRCLNYLERPTSGDIVIDGEAIGPSSAGGKRNSGASPRDIARMRMKLGMVFQQFNLWPHMTVLGNVIEALIRVKRMPRKEADRGRAECLAKRAICSTRQAPIPRDCPAASSSASRSRGRWRCSRR